LRFGIETALAAALGIHVISARVEDLRKALKTESATVRDSVRGLEARVMTAADWQKDRNSEVFSIVALLSKRVVSAERRVEQIEGTFDLNLSRSCRSSSKFEAHDVQQIEDWASKEQIPTGTECSIPIEEYDTSRRLNDIKDTKSVSRYYL